MVKQGVKKSLDGEAFEFKNQIGVKKRKVLIVKAIAKSFLPGCHYH